MNVPIAQEDMDAARDAAHNARASVSIQPGDDPARIRAKAGYEAAFELLKSGYDTATASYAASLVG